MINRRTYSAWNPSADEINAVPGTQLRGDNLVFDDMGILSLRAGSRVLYANLAANAEIHTLFTTTINDVRQRFAGVDNAVYRNGAQILSGFAGTGRIVIGQQFNQVFFARGTTKYKNDGNESQRWGIARPISAPSNAATPSDGKVFSSFNGAEAPAWVATEGVISGAPGQSNDAEGARILTLAANGNGTIQRVLGAETNFTAYDAGDTGIDEDLIEFYAHFSDPGSVESFTISFDVNGQSPNPLQDDYYVKEFAPEDAVSTVLDKTEVLDSDYTVEGVEREELLGKREVRTQPRSRIKQDTPLSGTNAGWSKFSVPRGAFERVGVTPGKDWSTVKAIVITVKTAVADGVTVGSVRFDDLRIIGGAHHPLTGTFATRYVFVRRYPDYIAKSAPSAVSAEVEVKAGGIGVTISAAAMAAKDGQATEAWIYVMGSTLNRFYRAATVTFAAATTIAMSATIQTKEAGILIEDEELETLVDVPPDNIIAICGPHFTRMLVLTAEGILAVSRSNKPDSFATNETFRVCNNSEYPLWMEKYVGGVLIGTSRDIYRVDGAGTENADGSLNFKITALGIKEAPTSAATAHSGTRFLYVASDGWRVLQGLDSVPFARANIEMLLRGYSRYGVNPPNLGAAPGRFRAGLTQNSFYTLWPENAGVADDLNIIYRYDFTRECWYRYTFNRTFAELYVEPHGSILLGDYSGNIWEMEVAGLGTDDGVAISVHMRTAREDGGAALNWKDPLEARVEVLASGGEITYSLYTANAQTGLGESAADSFALAASSSIGNPAVITRSLVSRVGAFKRVQTRITGTATALKLYGDVIVFRDRPMPRLSWASGPVDFGGEVTWVRRLVVKARVQVVTTATVYFDGRLLASPQITPIVDPTTPSTESPGAIVGVDFPYQLDVGRLCRGNQFEMFLNSDDGVTLFELYWIEIWYNVTGGKPQKKTLRVHVEQSRALAAAAQ